MHMCYFEISANINGTISHVKFSKRIKNHVICWGSTIVWFMVFNATFNYISVILWRSVLLMRKPEYPEKTTDLSQVTDKLYQKCCMEYTSSWVGFELTMLVVIDTNCTRSWKSNYHTITINEGPWSAFNISIHLSQTTGPIWIKLGRNGFWVVHDHFTWFLFLFDIHHGKVSFM
jgi:hypothetical protein